MLETSSEQSPSPTSVASTSAKPSASSVAPESLALSALNEALVDAIDHHGQLNMLSSYYYCTNLLDFKHHFGVPMLAAATSDLPTESPAPHHQLIPPTQDYDNSINSTTTELLDTKSSTSKLNKSRSRLTKRLKTSNSNSHSNSTKRVTTPTSTLSPTTTPKKVSPLSKLKSLLFKTCRTVTARNRLRYQRPYRYSKASSLSPTSPGSSSSSSSSSCSSSPELTQPTNRSVSLATSTYKRFRKIRNRLLRCNVAELINEETSLEEPEESSPEPTAEAPISIPIPAYTEHHSEPALPEATYTQAFVQASLTTLQPPGHQFPDTIYQQPVAVAVDHQFSHSQSTQAAFYDVDMLPAASLEPEEQQSTFVSHLPAPPQSPTETTISTTLTTTITAQQCQVKQDLLKMSYEKFKQFRLNEKLLQQTVLIRNAIKMLQYDIQFQQEQEQILVQQQQKIQHITETHSANMNYTMSETCQIEPVDSSQAYISSPLTSSCLSASSLQSQVASSEASTVNINFKNNSNPMLTAPYDNFDEFINNNILSLNNSSNTSNSNSNRQPQQNSMFERPRTEHDIKLELDSDDDIDEATTDNASNSRCESIGIE